MVGFVTTDAVATTAAAAAAAVAAAAAEAALVLLLVTASVLSADEDGEIIMEFLWNVLPSEKTLASSTRIYWHKMSAIVNQYAKTNLLGDNYHHSFTKLA